MSTRCVIRLLAAAAAVLAMAWTCGHVEAQARRTRRTGPAETATSDQATASPAPADATAAATTAPAPSGPAARTPTAADRQAAGQAYDRATAAYLAHDYPRAAALFETAYRLAPASAALLQAVRAHERAGNRLRAATLALRLRDLYGTEDAARRQADTTLAATASEFYRLDVTCTSSCTLEVDGVLQDHPSFFMEADTVHSLRASFETGNVEREVNGAAAQVGAISLDAPAAQVVAETTRPITGPVGPEDTSGGGLSPFVFVGGLVATAVVGGVLVWSGVDTLGGVSAYNAMPTEAGLADGQSRELRTNILIGVTGALAITTLVLALLTDWDGEPSASTEGAASVQATVLLSPELTTLQLDGRF